MSMKTWQCSMVALMVGMGSTTVLAEEASIDKTLDRVTVIGTPDNIKDIAGSAHIIDQDMLDKHEYTDVNRVLRSVPGLNIQEEEGYGNRPNIGIRGSRNDRSASVTLMEDGVLIAPAPYASPSAYYFPRVDRMEAVEVRKGTSAIRFGPRTTTGAVNFVSSSIPEDQDVKALGAIGSNQAERLSLRYGKSFGHVGFVADLGHDKTDGFKTIDFHANESTGYSIQDAMFKLRFSNDNLLDMYQEVEFKVGATQENSNESYLGLTDTDFGNDPYRRYAGSQRDNLDARHQNYHIRHYMEPTDGLDVTTTLYRNDFSRNWYKLDKVEGTSIADILDNPSNKATAFSVLTGSTSDHAGNNDLDVKANNRDYYSQGIQTIIGTGFTHGQFSHDIEIGLRYHYDEEDRLQHTDHYAMENGLMVLQTQGIAGDAGNRIDSATAWAAHIEDQIRFNNWTVTPGLRAEFIDLRREKYREGSNPDSNRSEGPTAIYEDDVEAFVPGLGVAYDYNKATSLFAGVHGGFSPPSPPNSATESPSIEESVNYEAGLRYGDQSLAFELVGYFSDYDNLLARCTSSSGGCELGTTFNGGEVDVYGLELGVAYDAASLIANSHYRYPLSVTYTYTKAEFQNSFRADDFDEWGTVSSGDTVPYVPENQLYMTAGVEAPKWMLQLSGLFVGEMRTKTESQAALDGNPQGTDAHFVFDLAAEYEVFNKTRMFLTVDNIFDEEYIAARRPAGIRPGKPQTIMTGLKLAF